MPSDRHTRAFERFRRRGDAAALGAVFDALAPRLLRLALHLTGDPARAEDVVQETFLVAIERRDAFDAGRRIEPWLVGICARIARARRRADAGQELPELIGGADPAELAADRDAREALEHALDGLAEPYRSTLRLRLLEGLSPAEVAVALDLAPGTVRSHLSRGLERLRDRLPSALLASLAAIAAPSRGLAAVRAEVLARAALVPVPVALTAGATASLPLLLLMKKNLLLPLAVLLVGVAVAVRLTGSGPADAPRTAAAGPTAPALGDDRPPRDQGPAPDERGAGPDVERIAAEVATEAAPEASAEDGPATWTVVLTGSGAPFAGVTGVLRSLETELPVEFDGAGRWRSGELRPGKWWLWLGHGGRSVTLEPGEHRADELEIGGAMELDLSVLDPDGRAVPGAEVLARRGFGITMAVGRTDLEGRFRSSGFRQQTEIVVRAAGYGSPASFELPPLERGRVERTVKLLPEGVDLVGRVVDATGATVAGAEVFLGPGRSPRVEGRGRLRTFSAADGAFAFPGLAPADADGFPSRREIGALDFVTAVLPGEAWGRSATFALRPGLGPIEVVLSRGGVVRGRVTDATGAPVVGARIEDREGDSFLSADSGEDGRFELAGMPVGEAVTLECLIWPQQMGLVRRTFELAPGEVFEWDVELAVGPSVAGVVRRADGLPVDRGQIDLRLEPSDGADRVGGAAWIEDDGRFEVRLPVGAERGFLWIRLAGYNSTDLAQGPFEVEAGDTEVELVLEDPERVGASIVVDVVGADGLPFAEATVTLCRLHPGGGGAFTDLVPERATGRAERVGLTPGLWGVAIDAPGHEQRFVGHRELAAGERWTLGAVEIGPPGEAPADWGEQVSGLSEATRAAFEADGVELDGVGR